MNKLVRNARVTRWLLLLQEFNITIIDRHGKDNVVVDFTTQVFQQRTNTFSNHSHNQIKDQHTDVLTW
jgi:hypothetical protein